MECKLKWAKGFMKTYGVNWLSLCGLSAKNVISSLHEAVPVDGMVGLCASEFLGHGWKQRTSFVSS